VDASHLAFGPPKPLQQVVIALAVPDHAATLLIPPWGIKSRPRRGGSQRGTP
jgi:hypothetical protein